MKIPSNHDLHVFSSSPCFAALSLGAQTVRHGFPYQPSSMAHDPVQKILAIGTQSGALRLYPFCVELCLTPLICLCFVPWVPGESPAWGYSQPRPAAGRWMDGWMDRKTIRMPLEEQVELMGVYVYSFYLCLIAHITVKWHVTL